jgi:hypothetical protein
MAYQSITSKFCNIWDLTKKSLYLKVVLAFFLSFIGRPDNGPISEPKHLAVLY